MFLERTSLNMPLLMNTHIAMIVVLEKSLAKIVNRNNIRSQKNIGKGNHTQILYRKKPI